MQIRLLVSHLPECANDARAAMATAQQAFAPFGLQLALFQGRVLPKDPTEIDQWPQLVQVLTDDSRKAGKPHPAHIVYTRLSPGADPSISGQLLDKNRGVCAVFLDADIFRVPDAAARAERIVHTTVHELGHLLNLIHADGFVPGTHSCAMMPILERTRQLPAAAWQAAREDAMRRGEPGLPIPVPARYYPFGAQCRANLRQATVDPRWLPWNSAFRGGSDGLHERSGSTLDMEFAREGALLARQGDGLAFTLRIRNTGLSTVVLPEHIGPEFGTLSVAVEDADGVVVTYHAEGTRCSSARQALRPQQEILRSFSLVPTPDEPMTQVPGIYWCTASLHGRVGQSLLTLGRAAGPLVVEPAPVSTNRAAARVVAKARRGYLPLTARDVSRVLAPGEGSVSAHHARYKIATQTSDADLRRELLHACMQDEVPTAVRHRAARRWVFDQLRAGRKFSRLANDMARRFPSAEDGELHQSLERMEKGWNRWIERH